MTKKFIESLEEYKNLRKVLTIILSVTIVGSIVIGCIAALILKVIS